MINKIIKIKKLIFCEVMFFLCPIKLYKKINKGKLIKIPRTIIFEVYIITNIYYIYIQIYIITNILIFYFPNSL